MIKNINKKGVSAIVATVLIILITVAAVTIIWAAIIPLVSNQLDESEACLAAVQGLSIGTQGYTCYHQGTAANDPTVLKVQVRRGANDAGLSNVQFSLDFSGNSESYTPTTGSDLPELNGALVYSISSTDVQGLTTKPSAVSIAPVIQLGNSEKTCEVAATLSEIPDCI